MNILEQAKEFYDQIDGDLFRDISMYGSGFGYVFITPKSLLLGKAVRTDSKYHPNSQWKVVAPNAWYVKVAIGDNCIQQFIENIPYPLPYVGWMREMKNKPIKWWNYERIKRRK